MIGRVGVLPSAAIAEQLRRNDDAKAALAEEFGLVPPDSVVPGAQWLAARQAFTMPTSAGVDMYPAFQFSSEGTPRPVIAEVLAAFRGRLSPWELALWWTASSGWLGGLRPVDVLDGPGEPQIVVAAQRLADEILA